MDPNRGRDDGDPPGRVVATRVVATRRRPLMVPAIVIVALVLAAIGFLGQKPVPNRPVEPTPTARPVAVEWMAIALDPASFAGALVGLVVSGPQGLLALGQDKADRHPIAWTSSDGQVWVRADLPPGTFGGGLPDAAVEVDSGFAAVGYHATVGGTTREIWTSADGWAWSRDPSPTGRGFAQVESLVGSGGAAVLLASTRTGRLALLGSRDGRVWTEDPDHDATFGRDSYIGSVIDAAPGFLAVGSVGFEGAVWRSSDGRAWTRATLSDPSLASDTRFDHVFRTATGFVLAGTSQSSGGSTVWASADGITWTPDTTSAVGLGELQAVLPLDGANLGVSMEAAAGGPGGLTIWADAQTSFGVVAPTDAPTDWSRQATVVGGRILALAQNAATERMEGWLGTVVGGRAAPATPSPAGSPGGLESLAPTPAGPPPVAWSPTPPFWALEWTRPTSYTVLADEIRDVWISGVATLGPRLFAFGSIGNDAVIWKASDAGHWQRLPMSPTMRGAAVRSVVAGPDGRLVAVGAILGPDGYQAPAAWTSPDGLTWTPAGGLREAGEGAIADVVAGPDKLVAVGSTAADGLSRAAVWTSADGSVWTAVSSVQAEPPGGSMLAVAQARTGYVAVGTFQPDGASSSGAAWTSPDGVTWSAVADQAAFSPPPETGFGGSGAEILDVVAGGPGFVAVGDSSTGRYGQVGEIFTSRDGREWTLLPSGHLFDQTYLRDVVTWAGGLAVAGEVVDSAGSSPAIWASRDGGEWTQIVGAGLAADLTVEQRQVSLSAITRYGPDLIGVGASGGYPSRGEGVVWVGAPATEIVPDHVCPTLLDTIVVIGSMTAADRAACIDPQGVTVSALARASDAGCTSDQPPELSGCGPYIEVAPLEGGPSLLTIQVDQSQLASFPTSVFSPWTLTLRSAVAGPACVGPRAPNGVDYQPPDGVRLQCMGVLRLISSHRIAGP